MKPKLSIKTAKEIVTTNVILQVDVIQSILPDIDIHMSLNELMDVTNWCSLGTKTSKQGQYKNHPVTLLGYIPSNDKLRCEVVLTLDSSQYEEVSFISETKGKRLLIKL